MKNDETKLWKVYYSQKSIQIIFQNTLIVEIGTLAARLKSTLWLKIGCQNTQIYMKTECLQTKWDAVFLGGKGKDRVALRKS